MKRVLVRAIVVGLIGLLSWTGLFASAALPSFAASVEDVTEEVISPDSQKYATREEAYDKAIQAANDPKGLDKEYEKDIKIFKKENPDDVSLVEKAKEAVEKVTGK